MRKIRYILAYSGREVFFVHCTSPENLNNLKSSCFNNTMIGNESISQLRIDNRKASIDCSEMNNATFQETCKLQQGNIIPLLYIRLTDYQQAANLNDLNDANKIRRVEKTISLSLGMDLSLLDRQSFELGNFIGTV